MRLSSPPLTRALVLLLPRLLLALAPGVSPSTPQPRLDVGATLGRGHYGEVFVYDESRVAKRASVLAPREEAAAAAAALSESSRQRFARQAPPLMRDLMVLRSEESRLAAQNLLLYYYHFVFTKVHSLF